MPTTYGIDVPSCVIMHAVMQNPNGITVYYGDSATPNVNLDADIIYGTGHGECCVFTVQNLQPMLEVPGSCSDGYKCGSTILPKLSGKKIHLFSCQTAIDLGRTLYNMGNEFLGYDTDITLATFFNSYTPCVDTPDSNTTAFTLADLQGTLSLLEGKGIKEAYSDTYQAYENMIKKYENSNEPIAPAVVRLLKANQLSLVSYPAPSLPATQPYYLIPLAESLLAAGLVVASLIS